MSVRNILIQISYRLREENVRSVHAILIAWWLTDTWLLDINLPQPLATTIKKEGYETPAKLLPLLLDTDAYDSFTDAIKLKARHARLLWKALEDLDVIMTPRSIGAKGPAAAEYKEDEEKMKQFQHLFQRCCDRTDEQGQPRMSMMGLHKAFVAMHVPVMHVFAVLCGQST
jgi:hypothetical protein